MCSNCVRILQTCQLFRRECRNRCIHQSMSIFRRTNFLWKDVLHVFHYDTWASESRPERVRLCVHTTEPTGPVPEPFHCDHIARWSARSGTTRPSGTGVNTGTRLRSRTVPVPKLWCEHGLSVTTNVVTSVSCTQTNVVTSVSCTQTNVVTSVSCTQTNVVTSVSCTQTNVVTSVSCTQTNVVTSVSCTQTRRWRL